MFHWTEWPAYRSPRAMGLFATALVLLLGYIDYITGALVSLSVIYVFPIAIAAWYVGPRLGYVLALFSVAIWIGGDIAGGFQFGSWLIPVWNSAIRVIFYGLVVEMLNRIRTLTRSLELKAQQRTVALSNETAERRRLERELLDIGERERRRIGYDLHDGLCQHLTGTALAVQVLREKLTRRGLSEAMEAEKIVDLIEEGIALSHRLAKGLQTVDMQEGGLMQALQEFAGATTNLFKVDCRFECESPIAIQNVGVADHLFRIAQEAVGNAIKHGRASKVVISLDADDEATFLRVVDDGIGIPDPIPSKGGMGMRIMAKRASLIGAEFNIVSNGKSGAVIVCCLPHAILSNQELVSA